MKFLIRFFTTLYLVAGASLALAAAPSQPTTALPLKVSIALPVAQFDFSDLDVRDEFNRPVAAPIVREHFEAVLNRELNRLLIENLTPVRRAYLALLSSVRDAFGDWLSSATNRFERTISAWLRGASHATAYRTSSVFAVVPSLAAAAVAANGASLSLLLRSIASTRLLR